MVKFGSLVFMLIFMICSQASVIAQELIKISDGYQRGDLHISDHRIGAYYQEFDPTAYHIYEKQTSVKRVTSGVAKVSAALAGTGLLLTIYSQRDSNNADPRINTAFVAGLAMFSVGAPLFVISGPIALAQSSRADKALKYFNNNPDNFLDETDSTYIQLGMTGNGVGFVLTFWI